MLQQLVTSVRGAVSAVKVDEDDQEKLDSTMNANLKKARTLASKISEDDVSKAHLRLNPANVLTLDTQPGILNLAGGQIATYDRETCTVALVDRDPNNHLVSRTTSVDCAWLKPELGQSQQEKYLVFQSTKLNRWMSTRRRASTCCARRAWRSLAATRRASRAASSSSVGRTRARPPYSTRSWRRAAGGWRAARWSTRRSTTRSAARSRSRCRGRLRWARHAAACSASATAYASSPSTSSSLAVAMCGLALRRWPTRSRRQSRPRSTVIGRRLDAERVHAVRAALLQPREAAAAPTNRRQDQGGGDYARDARHLCRH